MHGDAFARNRKERVKIGALWGRRIRTRLSLVEERIAGRKKVKGEKERAGSSYRGEEAPNIFTLGYVRENKLRP